MNEEELHRQSIQMEIEALAYIDRVVKEKFRKERLELCPGSTYDLRSYSKFYMGACA